ncbi:MAG: DUF2911 domain-containing protein [Chitinophagaceae bacterium]|nr:DUF2911 domain-containing protein [Chitinophagaceae bacterium]
MILNRSAVFLFLTFGFISCTQNEAKEDPTPSRADTPVVNIQPTNSFTPVDISPMDMIYFPVDYPVLKMSDNENMAPVARVIYSRPHREGRKIFGELLKYGEIWRLGANEATEIEFFRRVKIQDKTVQPGRYLIYCIPNQDNWIIALNKNIYAWGLKIKPEQDIQRFTIPIETLPASTEFFTMFFEPTEKGANLVMTWEEILTRLPLQF